MITAGEIRKKSEAKYLGVLQSSLKDENCFPLTIRSNKALSKDFVQMSKEIADVFSASKERKGFGYSVISEPVNTRQHGIQDIPKAIIFESLPDYLKFLNKEKEYHLMMENYSFIKSELPQLNSWLKENPKAIIDNRDVWPGLLKVCEWFLKDFEPNKYYIRELPISVHTKFVEENRAILKHLLDELVPNIVDGAESLLEKRFHLKYDQPMVRFRSLDINCWNFKYCNELTVPVEQFSGIPINCSRVFIVENKMNFLTFPQVSMSIAIWGKGFAIELLKNIEWLKGKEIYYWSDLDVHGFLMLSQLRSYYPQTKSFLMEMTVVENYAEFIVPGATTNTAWPSCLTEEEFEVYKFFLENSYRLEQERIHQNFVQNRLKKIFG